MKLILCCGISVRSGTNYLGSLFSEIPNVASIPKEHSHGEFPFFREEVINKYHGWVQQFNQKMFSFHSFNEKHFSPFFGRCILEYVKEEYQIREPILFVKDPSIYQLQKFHEFFPDGKLIILTRNAADLIASSLAASIQIRKSQKKFKMLKAKLKYITGFAMWSYSRAYKRHAHQLLFLRREIGDKFLEVKYEDLVIEPDTMYSTLLKYCEIPFNDEIIERMKTSKVVGSSFFGAQKHTQKWAKVNKNNEFNPIGRFESWGWFNKWVFNRFAAESNRKIGYKNPF